MKRFAMSVFGVSIMAMMPVIAGAAGTYYNGNLYQTPQRYGNNSGGYYNNYGANRAYGQQKQSMAVRNAATRGTKNASANQGKQEQKQGFQLDVSLGHEFANWDLEMKNAGSKLRYDNLRWNIVSGELNYYFGSSTPMQIKVGGRYGVQYGETAMIDDDISNGAYGYAYYPGVGDVYGYAMSVGTSKDGTQYGFNAAFGLTDFFKIGRAKITPSLGYRYFKHTLYTKNNNGLTMDILRNNVSGSTPNYYNCIDVGGETQCDPLVEVYFYNGDTFVGSAVGGRADVNADGFPDTDIYVANNTGANIVYVDLGDTYYYQQQGTSHKYDTVWQGPYIAFDMEYEIDKNNLVDAGIEFGLPMYNSKGDQPYRIDWQHPTSVEDKGGFGKAYHIGLNANWSTAITDSTMFTLGIIYDYYKVNGADAITYLNPSWYQPLLEAYEEAIADGGLSDDVVTAYQKEIQKINGYKSNGWKIESKDEIKSIYSAMGIRLGVNVKF